MAIGEAILGAILGGLLTALTSHDFLTFARREGILKRIDKWGKTLLLIQQVLIDAEEKQLTERAVKSWLDDLRDLAYDVDDLLDEFATESFRRNLTAAAAAAGDASNVLNLVSTGSFFSRFRGSTSKFSRKIRSKINSVDKRLNVISKRRVELGLESRTSTSSGSGSSEGGLSSVWQKPPSASVPNDPVIFGREEDKSRIIELLLLKEWQDDVDDAAAAASSFYVVPIVGMGGIGKTTLAQHVYNAEAVIRHFHLRAWVCVSKEFDVMRIAKAILESITGQACDLNEYNEVQVRLTEALAGKKFLLVLDDVWNKNYGLWEALRPPFTAGASGSVIIVTTREVNVATMIGPSKYYDLKPLSDDECWAVFAKHAFENRGINPQTNLKLIRKKIVRKCRGLPLAARTLGGLLRSKQRDDEWEDILNSKIWDLSDSESDIVPVLRLSYYHLPSHLKRCFSYCAILPKDFEFREKDLVLLWMAEGLIEQTSARKMEDLGREYFRDLVSRSIFQLSSCDKSQFVMHDLVNDLAQWAAGEICIKLDSEMQSSDPKKARYSSYVRNYCDGIRKFEFFHKTSRLRTFLPLPFVSDQGCWLTNHVLFDLLPKLRCLRVLSLSSYNISDLPDSIGELTLLRFLNLSHTRLSSLPESICSLYNLQTLLLNGCSSLRCLPSKIENLVNLRHLDIANASSIKEMPFGIGALKNLQTLSDFVVGEETGSRITALVNLKSLQGTLCISGLENVSDARHAREAGIDSKQDVDVLFLKWGFKFDDSRDGSIEKDVLEDLRPHGKLKELTIWSYAGSRFPTWVGNPSFASMVHLRLENCLKCTLLPPLGQLPSLKMLSIIGLTAIKKVGHEFHGDGCSKSFPVLEVLQFEGMHEWEEWVQCGIGYEMFPLLRDLSVTRCPKLLEKLPRNLPSLEKLTIENCRQMVVSIGNFPRLCRIEIKGCKTVVNLDVVDLISLNSMIIANVSKLTGLTQGFSQPFMRLKELEIMNCSNLVSLYQNGKTLAKQLSSVNNLIIHGCPQVASLVTAEEGEEEQVQQQLANCKLGTLTLRSCETFEKLPQWFHSLMSLRELIIQDCPRLVSTPVAGLPRTLKVIRVLNCNGLTSLPGAVTSNSMFLEHLCIQGCDSIISFGRNQLPPTLKKLELKSCKNLLSLLDDEDTSSSSLGESSSGSALLEDLFIEKCEALVSIASRGSFPAALKHLRIDSCPKLIYLPPGERLSAGLKQLTVHSCQNLKSVVDSFHNNLSLKYISIWFCNSLESLPRGLHKLRSLREISISYCSNIISFPEDELPTSLRRLIIVECEKLQKIPACVYKLTSLQELKITYCPNIVSFPEEGLPTSLTSLWIIDLKICKLLFDWGMHKLKSLRSLFIQGGCEHIVSFPTEEIGMVLPATLTRLRIRNIPNLNYLSSKGFESLTCLQELWISDCPKLASFPKTGLPPSVLELRIERCPLLLQHFPKGTVNEWLKIRHIPYIKIDGKFQSYSEF